jgi:hypothetical protein
MPHTNMMVPSGVQNATGLNREREILMLKTENDQIRRAILEMENAISYLESRKPSETNQLI